MFINSTPPFIPIAMVEEDKKKPEEYYEGTEIDEEIDEEEWEEEDWDEDEWEEDWDEDEDFEDEDYEEEW